MKKYDYLIVGSGLFGAVFAHEAHKRGKNALLLNAAAIWGGIFTAKTGMVSIFIIMVDIFSILLIKKYGTTSINLLNLIIMSILPLLTIKGSCITFHLT